MTSSSRAAIAVIILKVEPGGYWLWIALFSIGFFLSSKRDFHSLYAMPLEKMLGSKEGRLSRANISPESGLIATSAPALSPKESSTAFCIFMSMLSLTSSPLIGGLPCIIRSSLPRAFTSMTLSPGTPLSLSSYKASTPHWPINASGGKYLSLGFSSWEALILPRYPMIWAPTFPKMYSLPTSVSTKSPWKSDLLASIRAISSKLSPCFSFMGTKGLLSFLFSFSTISSSFMPRSSESALVSISL